MRQNFSRHAQPRPVRVRHSQSGVPLSSIVFVVCAALALGVVAFLVSGGANSLAGETVRTYESTPKSQWRQGVMPSLYQKDPQWKGHLYAGNEFGESGCGPICLAMVNVFLTGDTHTSPTDIADRATAGGYASTEGTSWAFMVEGAALLGLQGREIPITESAVRASLSQGNPIICIMGAGDFTTTGHFIVLCGIDAEGNVEVRDSNSPDRTAKRWQFDDLQGQCLGAWTYSV